MIGDEEDGEEPFFPRFVFKLAPTRKERKEAMSADHKK